MTNKELLEAIKGLLEAIVPKLAEMADTLECVHGVMHPGEAAPDEAV
jgi:hypothetical protein